MFIFWQNSDDNTYYVNEYGVRAKNQWISVENEDDTDVNGEEVDTLWYYFGDNGKAYKAESADMKKKTCPDATGSRTYFFDSEGHMISGWVDYEGETYYCGTENEGWAYTGWQYLEPDNDLNSDEYDDQEWFNFKSSGKARKNTTWYSKGRYYTFDANGIMNSDWYDLKIATVATDENGNNVIGTSNTTITEGAYTSENGSKGTGWVYTEDAGENDSYWFYLVSFKDSDGTVRNVPFNSISGDEKMRAKVIKGKTYIFKPDGTMKDGLVVLTNKNNNAGVSDYKGGAVSKKMANGTYYFNENSGSAKGQMVTGKTTVTKDGEDYYYYFDSKTGCAITNVVKDGVVYGPNGERIDAEDGNSNAIVTLDEAVEYSKSSVVIRTYTDADGKEVKVYGIPANSEVIVSSTGKLRTSGTVKVDGVKYKVHNDNWYLEKIED